MLQRVESGRRKRGEDRMMREEVWTEEGKYVN